MTELTSDMNQHDAGEDRIAIQYQLPDSFCCESVIFFNKNVTERPSLHKMVKEWHTEILQKRTAKRKRHAEAVALSRTRNESQCSGDSLTISGDSQELIGDSGQDLSEDSQDIITDSFEIDLEKNSDDSLHVSEPMTQAPSVSPSASLHTEDSQAPIVSPSASLYTDDSETVSVSPSASLHTDDLQAPSVSPSTSLYTGDSEALSVSPSASLHKCNLQTPSVSLSASLHTGDAHASHTSSNLLSRLSTFSASYPNIDFTLSSLASSQLKISVPRLTVPVSLQSSISSSSFSYPSLSDGSSGTSLSSLRTSDPANSAARALKCSFSNLEQSGTNSPSLPAASMKNLEPSLSLPITAHDKNTTSGSLSFPKVDVRNSGPSLSLTAAHMENSGSNLVCLPTTNVKNSGPSLASLAAAHMKNSESSLSSLASTYIKKSGSSLSSFPTADIMNPGLSISSPPTAEVMRNSESILTTPAASHLNKAGLGTTPLLNSPSYNHSPNFSSMASSLFENCKSNQSSLTLSAPTDTENHDEVVFPAESSHQNTFVIQPSPGLQLPPGLLPPPGLPPPSGLLLPLGLPPPPGLLPPPGLPPPPGLSPPFGLSPSPRLLSQPSIPPQTSLPSHQGLLPQSGVLSLPSLLQQPAMLPEPSMLPYQHSPLTMQKSCNSDASHDPQFYHYNSINNLYEKKDIDVVLKMDDEEEMSLDIDLQAALMKPPENPAQIFVSETSKDISTNIEPSQFECDPSLCKHSPSAFGRVMVMIPHTPRVKRPTEKTIYVPFHIFRFDSPSPDDLVREALQDHQNPAWYKLVTRERQNRR